MLGISASKVLESPSENSTISYMLAIFLRNWLSPGLFFTTNPFPKTYSAYRRVPVTLRTRVLGAIAGWMISGMSFLTGGLVINCIVWAVLQ